LIIKNKTYLWYINQSKKIEIMKTISLEISLRSAIDGQYVMDDFQRLSTLEIEQSSSNGYDIIINSEEDEMELEELKIFLEERNIEFDLS